MTGAMPGAPGDDCGGVLAVGRLADWPPMRGWGQLENAAWLGPNLEAARGQRLGEIIRADVIWYHQDHGRYSQIG